MTSRVGATPESVEMHARDKAPSIADTASVQAEAYVVGDTSVIAAAAGTVSASSAPAATRAARLSGRMS